MARVGTLMESALSACVHLSACIHPACIHEYESDPARNISPIRPRVIRGLLHNHVPRREVHVFFIQQHVDFSG